MMNDKDSRFDVIVLGGGAAGMMAAITAGNRGKRVLLLETSNKLGKKILMSGGGRCNFTNLDVGAEKFISSNPHFVKSALSQYSQWDFIALVNKYGIAYHEKQHGQLFCDNSAKDILAMLVSECDLAKVNYKLNCDGIAVDYRQNSYLVSMAGAQYQSSSLIVATGGLSIPTLGGATGFGYTLAEQFGLKQITRAASLVPMTLSGRWLSVLSQLSGVSLSVSVSVPAKGFTEDMLFTHRGLSGPAILQLSNYWQLGQDIKIDLLPSLASDELYEQLRHAKKSKPNSLLRRFFQAHFPKAMIQVLQQQWWPDNSESVLHEISDQRLLEIAQALKAWHIKPSGTEGYRTAEVTMGGVDTDCLSSKTMEVKNQSGLFFVGEVVDVTGHLGGYNFQWAWSSAYVAGSNA